MLKLDPKQTKVRRREPVARQPPVDFEGKGEPLKSKKKGTPRFDGRQAKAQALIKSGEGGAETRPVGTTTARHGSSAAQRLDHLPATAAAAKDLLKSVGIDTGARLKSAQVPEANRFLAERYRGDFTETVGDQRAYLKDPSYDLRLVHEGKEAVGVASGFKFSTGFQLDYFSLLERPRNKKDVTAGLALLRQMAESSGADKFFVEVDATMEKHYLKAGFQVIARPPEGEKIDLTMLVLPLTDEAKQQVTLDPKSLWLQHIDDWYTTNFDGLTGKDRAGADEALGTMRKAAANGELVWVQRLPARDG
jgi:hypothetical protein